MSKFLVMLVFVLVADLCWTQPANQNRKKKPYTWIFTGGYVIVNDNEEKLPNLFDVQGSWNYAAYPSYFSVNKFLKKGFSNEGVFTYTPYRNEAMVNGKSGVDGFLFSANYAYKFSVNQFIKQMPKDIDPFIAVGGGLTYRFADSGGLCATANLHLGMNLWLNKHWGIQAQGIGKLALVKDIYTTPRDYVQLTAGISYRTLPRKRYVRDKPRYGWTRERNRYRKGDSR